MNKQYEIFPNGYRFYQGDGYHFTSDAVKLASFVKTKKTDSALELCAGSGIISIYAYSNKPFKAITFVEIQKELCDIIQENITLNKIENATVINANINDIKPNFFKNKFDVIICNPPYEKITKTSNLQSDYKIAIARHELLITLDELIKQAARLIKDKGHFYIVHKAERTAELINTLKKYNFECKEMNFVFNKNKPNPYIVLIDAIYNGSANVRITCQTND